MALLFDSVFSAVALSHLGVDAVSSTRAVLLVFLSGPLGLSNSSIGLISTLHITTAALAQPLFGYLADRLDSRWIVVGGVLWTVLFFSLTLAVPGQIALVFLILSSIGSGAFHPVGAMHATMRGHTHFAGQEATASSYFFLFGRLGYFVGPFLGGLLLSRFGVVGLFALAIPSLPIGAYAAWNLRHIHNEAKSSPPKKKSSQGILRISKVVLLAFVLVAAFQSMSEQNMIAYLPKFLSDLGQSPTKYGFVSALFMGGSILGEVAGGILADRFGKQRVAFITFVLASGPLIILPHVGATSWLLLVIPLAGALIGAAHSIIIVRAQHIIPGGRALASGLVLGFMFSSGALGTYISGHIADLFGFAPVFYLTGVISLAAAGLAFALSDKKE